VSAGVVDRVVVAHLFLTRLRLPRRGEVDADALRRAAVMFPLVGLTVGGLCALVRLAADPLGPVVATLLALAVAPVVTGAFHEDGLADTADALGPHDRERRLVAMRDPRLGAFGVLALVFGVGLRVGALAPMSARDAALALVAAHVLGRWSTLPLARWAPAARQEGSGPLLARVDAATLAGGTALALALAVPALLLVSGWAAIALAVAVLVTSTSGFLWVRAVGGVTGDTYGATNQLVEIATYVVASAAVS
jgi:adenosylcobinamide-GDP ribazoletransferase